MGVTKQERIKEYQRLYSKAYNLQRKIERLERLERKKVDVTEQINSFDYIQKVINREEIYIPDLDGNEGLLCSTFGCGSTLSNVEKLCGNKCNRCMGRGRYNPSA